MVSIENVFQDILFIMIEKKYCFIIKYNKYSVKKENEIRFILFKTEHKRDMLLTETFIREKSSTTTCIFCIRNGLKYYER